jgi:hypothetical protein
MAKKTQENRRTGRATSEGMGATRKGTPEAGPEVAAFLGSGDANLTTAMRAGEAMVKGMAAWQQQLAEYAHAEFKQGLAASETLRGCRDPVELFNLQCDLTRQARQRFFDETSKLMMLASRIGGECWQPFEDRTKENLDRIAGR